MKRIISLALVAVMLTLMLASCFGEGEPKNPIYVTIVTGDGTLAVAHKALALSDADGDGKLTVNDALYLAHERAYTGGAAAGYASELGQYGISLTRLWGVSNGGAYGYYVNNASATSLADEVKAEDHVVAFIYQDTVTWSDTYAYFDAPAKSAEKGKSVTLTLSATAYDESWNPVTVGLSNALITVNGEATSYTTDASGSVTMTFDRSGTYTVSATSPEHTLVSPVCIIRVK